MDEAQIDKFAVQYTFLSKDDWIYTGLLAGKFLGSFLLAICQRFLVRGEALYGVLRNSPGAIGFSVALFVLGWKIVYSLPIAIFATLMITFGPRKDNKTMPLIVFVVVFSYLLITRHLHEFIPLPELASQANALQLLITLRAIGLAYEVADGRYNAANPGKLKHRRYLTEYNPDPFMIFNYLYHYCGLFTGPYYSYQMFLDSSDPTATGFHELFLQDNLFNEFRSRLTQLLWALPVFVITNRLFPLDGLRTDDVFEWSMTYKLMYAAAVFVVFRMRVYSAWAVSECICVTLNIGIYPQRSKPKCVVGPTDLEAFAVTWSSSNAVADSTAIQNIDVPEVEASEGFRSGVRAWNKSVQSWLALYVHSRSPPAIRFVLTMFVSALWHGTYAGYFMSFLVVPLCAAAEDVLFRLFPRDKITGEKNLIFHYFYVLVVRCRGFDMMATGFLLKNWKDTHRFWSALHYWLPITMIITFIVASLIERVIGSEKKKDKEKDYQKVPSE